MIYEPEEDSYFLKGFVEKFAEGKVLDIGTGSGIQAVSAAKKKEVKSVLAIDINPEAISSFPLFEPDIEPIIRKKIKCIESDLFSNVKEKFNTIIFNPPYLPSDESDGDLALDGGKEGHELIEKFLLQAKDFLLKNGFILLLYSNRTGKEKVDSLIINNGFFSVELGKISLPFFEELYVCLLRIDEKENKKVVI